MHTCIHTRHNLYQERIKLHRSPCAYQSRFLFCGHFLPLSDFVLQLGNTLNFNLSDKPDIQAKVMALFAQS